MPGSNDIDAGINLGGKRHTRSTSPPASPVIGDTWDEITVTGDWVCEWFWNGSYWLSRQIFVSTAIPQVPSGGDAFIGVSAGSFGSPQISQTRYNLFLINFSTSYYIAPTNNSSNYWTLTLTRRSSNNTTTSLVSFNTQSESAGVRINKILTLNLHLNLTAQDVRLLRIDAVPTGSPSNCQLIGHLLYRWARP